MVEEDEEDSDNAEQEDDGELPEMEEDEEEDDEPADAEDVDEGVDSDEEGWVRDDQCAHNERAKRGFLGTSDAKWDNPPEEVADEDWLFTFAKSVLNPPRAPRMGASSQRGVDERPYLKILADLMQENGRAKGEKWSGWKVTEHDVLQWLGMWYYMLAFPGSPRLTQEAREAHMCNNCMRMGPRLIRLSFLG